jgi:hypothetical protein
LWYSAVAENVNTPFPRPIGELVPLMTPTQRRASMRRRASGHTCTSCGRPWALRAAVETHERDRHRFAAWVVRCRFCDYRRPIRVVGEAALVSAS